LRLGRVRRARRRLRQIVDDIEFCSLDVRANGEAKVNEACTPTDERVDIGEPGSVAQYIFLPLIDVGQQLTRATAGYFVL